METLNTIFSIIQVVLAVAVIVLIALQKSKEAALISKNKPDDEGVFMEDQAIFGTAAYGSAAAAFPHLVYAGVVS